MRASCLDQCWIESLEKLIRDLSFGVTFRTAGSCLIQCREDGRLGDVLQHRPLAKAPFPQRCAEVLAERAPVGQEPRFHHLDHEKSLIVAGVLRSVNIGLCFQVLPHRMSSRDGLLAVNEKEWQLPRTRIRDGGSEQVQGLRAPFSTDDPGQMSCQTSAFKKRSPSGADESVVQRTRSSTLCVDLRAHERFPPISPLLHRSPSVYFSSHAFSAP